jgi:HTH-type transcriptional regulator/antitoxin HigA
MRKAGHKQVAAALYRKNDQNRANAKTNPYALNAWCWQILAQANEKDRVQAVQSFENRFELMSEVAKLSPATDGPLRAVDFLAEQGIAVEIARHLPGTHLDGAAMKSVDGSPVIGLTLRYDRLDHFWYTLEHELAHALYHLDENSGPFFDDLGLDSVGDKEEYADEKAKESLIPTDVWMSSEVGKKRSPMAVIGLAHELGIHPAIVAGRARHEEQDYRRWSQLLGSGTVRGLFGV